MTDKIEFSDEELKRVNSFEPQMTKEYLNDLLRDKIALAVDRVKQTYCKHDSVGYENVKQWYICNHCGREWK